MNTYDFTLDTLKEAGVLLMRLRSEAFETLDKDGDPRNIVTSVDLAVNDFITRRIQSEFPDHAIHSEEAATIGEATHVWSIDPIDGSSNFSRGIPHFAMCLGLSVDGVPTVGGVLNPVTNELFSFKKGEGAFLNGAPIRVSEVRELKSAFVFFHTGRKPELWQWGGESYSKLLEHAKKTSNFGSTSLDTCFVAAGRIEASVYGTFSTLDIASAVGILTEAGGIMADANGEPVELSNTVQKVYTVNNQEILDQLRAIV